MYRGGGRGVMGGVAVVVIGVARSRWGWVNHRVKISYELVLLVLAADRLAVTCNNSPHRMHSRAMPLP